MQYWAHRAAGTAAAGERKRNEKTRNTWDVGRGLVARRGARAFTGFLARLDAAWGPRGLRLSGRSVAGAGYSCIIHNNLVLVGEAVASQNFFVTDGNRRAIRLYYMHEHSQRSPKASSGCSRWPYRPSAQLGQAHRMNGGPGRRCCGVASATPRCRIDSASQFDPADAWSDDHRQQSPTRAHRRRAGALRRIELEPDARGCRQSACEPPRAGARC